MENKLIKLFKHCCDSPKFSMDHSLREAKPQIYLHKEKGFGLPKDIVKLFTDVGLSVYWEADGYATGYGRRFNFDSEPPLFLVSAKYHFKTKVDSKHASVS